MVLDLKLAYGYGKYSDKCVNLATGEIVNIKLMGEKHLAGLEYFAIIQCGRAKITQRISETGIFNIPLTMTDKTGSIDVLIQARDVNGAVVCEYNCENLVVKVVDSEIVVIPQVEALDKRVARVEKALQEIYKIIKSKGDLGL